MKTIQNTRAIGLFCGWIFATANLSNATDLTINPGVNNAGAVAELVDALKAAQATGGPVTINLFPNGVYTFTGSHNSEYGPNALPQIASEVTIDGRAAVLQRADGSPSFRFLYVSGGLSYDAGSSQGLRPGSLTLKNITLRGGVAQGGSANNGGGGAGMGGAIFSQGNLVMTGVTIAHNKAQGGSSGVAGAGSGGGGIGANSTGESGGGFGGSFAGKGGEGGAGNTGGGGGGGGFRPQDNGSPASQLNPGGGGLGGGGGGHLLFSLTTTLSANGGAFGHGGSGSFGSDASGGGGGVGGGGGHGGFNGGDGNGGFGGGGGGGGIYGGFGGFGGGGGNGDSAGPGGFAGGFGLSGDKGGGGGGGMGGAVFSHRGSVTMTNCTVVANTAQGGNGGGTSFPGASPKGGNGYGGAVFNLNGTLRVNSCTIASNSVVAGSSLVFVFFGSNQFEFVFTGEADGGAVYNLSYGNKIEDGTASTATVFFQNVIVANSTGGTNDLVNNSIVTFSGKNLVTRRRDVPGANSVGVPTLTSDPLLGPLANNGGATPTMELMPGSPAIDSGAIAGAPGVDQRGIARPEGSGIDLGSFEVSLRSFLRNPRWTNQTFEVTITALNGKNYQLEFKNALNDTTWTPLSPVLGNGGVMVLRDQSGSPRQRFYRVSTW